MKPEILLPIWQAFTTSPQPKPDISILCLPNPVFKFHFITILLLMLRSAKCSPSLSYPHQNPVCNFSVANTCHTPCQPHSILCLHPNVIWSVWQTAKFLVLHSVISTLLRINILLSSLFLDILSLSSSISMTASFTPIQNSRQNYSSV